MKELTQLKCTSTVIKNVAIIRDLLNTTNAVVESMISNVGFFQNFRDTIAKNGIHYDMDIHRIVVSLIEYKLNGLNCRTWSNIEKEVFLSYNPK